jgi:hypothetical protein
MRFEQVWPNRLPVDGIGHTRLSVKVVDYITLLDGRGLVALCSCPSERTFNTVSALHVTGIVIHTVCGKCMSKVLSVSLARVASTSSEKTNVNKLSIV